MASEGTIRFIQTGDWRLDQPLGGLGPEADAADPVWTMATVRAASAVVDVALERNVDFVLLGGHTLARRRATPFLLKFFRDQLVRLSRQKIPVYWNPAEPPADRWPDVLPLPANVTVADRTQPRAMACDRPNRPAATVVLGGPVLSRDDTANLAKLQALGSAAQGPCIVMLNGPVDSDRMQGTAGHYWAAAGDLIAEAPRNEGVVQRGVAGSPQGRSPEDTGPHGVLLVQWSAGQGFRREFIETDVVRYESHRLDLPPETGSSSAALRLEQMLSGPLAQRAVQMKRRLCVTIDLDFQSEWPTRLHPALFCHSHLAAWQRRQLGKDVWLCAVRWQLPGSDPGLREEDSILGDYLRVLDTQRADPQSWQRLVRYLPEDSRCDPIRQRVLSQTENVRAACWQAAECEGALLLQGVGLDETVEAEK